MRYSASISDEEYAALEDGYDQGRRNADPGLRQENAHLRRRCDQYFQEIQTLKRRIKELEA